ncbi:hypothetical protein MJG53_016019 [Ovis ammon polii x Ovis aries]|uniref:Uncharacterized protein n=1 Tax=Ovis ammon polii x Ovis aries TaxID=2918886 RepID=A0ACB9UDK6_9CETA|nr:hypothetical protein MJG53_016019 [Ovis ammon polii x Ovis aries]
MRQPVEPVLGEEALAVASSREAGGHGAGDSRKRRRNTTDREDVDWDEGRRGFLTNHVFGRGSSLRPSPPRAEGWTWTQGSLEVPSRSLSPLCVTLTPWNTVGLGAAFLLFLLILENLITLLDVLLLDPVPGCTHGCRVSGPEHRGTVPMDTALPGFLTSMRFAGKTITENFTRGWLSYIRINLVTLCLRPENCRQDEFTPCQVVAQLTATSSVLLICIGSDPHIAMFRFFHLLFQTSDFGVLRYPLQTWGKPTSGAMGLSVYGVRAIILETGNQRRAKNSILQALGICSGLDDILFRKIKEMKRNT